MTTMITEVYDALKEAGASDEKARKAAETLADYNNRFHKLESNQLLIKWMVGFNLAVSVALLFKSFV